MPDQMVTTNLDTLNQSDINDFTELLGDVVEHSPHIPAKVFVYRPFNSVQELIEAFRKVIFSITADELVEIFNSHPELSGKEASNNELTEFSSKEQMRLGLNKLNTEQFKQMSEFNRKYREKFGFPFIVCVGFVKDLEELFRIQTDRFENNQETEISNAGEEVLKIIGLRIQSIVI